MKGVNKMSDEDTHPYFFKSDRDIDRRQCKRVIPMQVLSLGMPRTGTTCKLSASPAEILPAVKLTEEKP